MKLLIYLEVLKESLRFALQSLRANLLRTLLSLLGITIGIFCIISISTLIDSLEFNIRSSVARLGENVVMVQKWPWGFDSNYPWWQYVNRPEVKYREMQQLQKRFDKASAVCFNSFLPNQKLTYHNNAVEELTVRAASYEYDRIVSMDFDYGRYFTESESQRGEPVVILGHDLAVSLFGSASNAVDKEVRLFERPVRVAGVLRKEGKGMGIGGQQDNMALIPLNFARTVSNIEDPDAGANATIMVKAAPGESIDALEEDLRGVFRSIRRLSPRQDDNFALNKITLFTSFLTKMFEKINLYGWIIAGFSILVGGFGIANIMFVSVKERTPIIGIQKALGAKRFFILIQFLGESVMLCILGGIIGLLLMSILTLLLNLILPMQIFITLKNILMGIGISSVIGILSGYIPARQAAVMDPIEAIRSNG